MSEEQRLLETKNRLDIALNRLETAVAARVQAGDQAGTDTNTNDAELARLTVDLATARARHDDLRSQTDTAADRLDGTIGRLKSILEN